MEKDHECCNGNGYQSCNERRERQTRNTSEIIIQNGHVCFFCYLRVDFGSLCYYHTTRINPGWRYWTSISSSIQQVGDYVPEHIRFVPFKFGTCSTQTQWTVRFVPEKQFFSFHVLIKAVKCIIFHCLVHQEVTCRNKNGSFLSNSYSIPTAFSTYIKI